MLEGLRVCLIGSQMDFITLDNFMENNGFYSVADNGIIDNIKEDKNVYYTSKNDQNNILISFDVLSNTYYNDDFNFLLEVNSIEIA